MDPHTHHDRSTQRSQHEQHQHEQHQHAQHQQVQHQHGANMKHAEHEPTNAQADHGHSTGHADHGAGKGASDHGGMAHAGHGAHDKHAGHSPEMFRRKFWLSLALTIPILGFDHHIQDALGIAPFNFPGAEWLTPLLSVILFAYGGSPFIISALAELKARKPGMMTLISLAISVAFFYSIAVTLGFVGGMPLYWELATLIDIMLLGHWIEMSSIQGAGEALQHLASLVPSVAHVIHGESIHDMPVANIRTGDKVLVRPGEQVPLDGKIIEGRSSFNESFLTGESKPVSKNVGDEVLAGSVNGEGAVTFETVRTGESTTLSQIQRLVNEAQASRSRFQNLADRAASILTYIAIGAGTTTLVVWLLSGSTTDFAIIRTVAVLVMACPHALGLAIPLVIVNATSHAAKHGILVRNREAFERAREIKIVAFDKTGTLTEGNFGLVEMATDDLPADEALSLAATLERRSEHPLAKAIVQAASERKLALKQPEDFTVDAGRGVNATIEGVQYFIGSHKWIEERNARMSDKLDQFMSTAESKGETTIVLFNETAVLAVFALGDSIKADAKQAIANLREHGITSVMITGDSETVAKSVARELGIDKVHARVLPQDKASLVRSLREGGAVAFVGDGVNDAPALLEAELGIAIGAGTNVAIESADLVLINSRPSDVANALTISRLTYRKMTQNLLWATGYNAIALPLAAGVAIPLGIVVSPAIGAIFMSASTIIVAVNAILLRRSKLI